MQIMRNLTRVKYKCSTEWGKHKDKEDGEAEKEQEKADDVKEEERNKRKKTE